MPDKTHPAKEPRMMQYVIYDHPLDYPGKWVVRR